MSEAKRRAVSRLPAALSGPVIDSLGGTVAVAGLCHVNHSTVCAWRRLGIPLAWTMFLQARFPTVPAVRNSLAWQPAG